VARFTHGCPLPPRTRPRVVADSVGAPALREERQPCRWWVAVSLSMQRGTGVAATASGREAAALGTAHYEEPQTRVRVRTRISSPTPRVPASRGWQVSVAQAQPSANDVPATRGALPVPLRQRSGVVDTARSGPASRCGRAATYAAAAASSRSSGSLRVPGRAPASVDQTTRIRRLRGSDGAGMRGRLASCGSARLPPRGVPMPASPIRVPLP
jgi:hypothetical protein